MTAVAKLRASAVTAAVFTLVIHILYDEVVGYHKKVIVTRRTLMLLESIRFHICSK